MLAILIVGLAWNITNGATTLTPVSFRQIRLTAAKCLEKIAFYAMMLKISAYNAKQGIASVQKTTEICARMSKRRT